MLKVGDYVAFKPKYSNEYRYGVIVAKRFNTCRVIFDYKNGLRMKYTRRVEDLKKINKSDILRKEKENVK